MCVYNKFLNKKSVHSFGFYQIGNCNVDDDSHPSIDPFFFISPFLDFHKKSFSQYAIRIILITIVQFRGQALQ